MSGPFKVLSCAFAIVAIAILAASCGSGNAQYRVVNAIPNTTTFDPNGFAIYMNGTGLWTDVEFPATEPSSSGKYQSVSGGTDTIQVYPTSEAGQTGAVAVISSALNLGGGTQYTVVLAGNSTASGATYPLAAQLITDNNPTPTSGDAGIRVIDASISLSEQGSVDVLSLPTGDTCCAGATTIGSGLQYPQNTGTGNINTGYQNVGIPTNGSVTLWVTAHNNTADQIYHNSLTVTAGQNYTVVLVDSVGGASPPQFVDLEP
ncbi:MAG: DUF4397 domain-containing protein [Terriglobales bacterium]